ncbi:MAG: hypothetical protein ABJP45_01905 [Cyclobacteriaceae bacterium]
MKGFIRFVFFILFVYVLLGGLINLQKKEIVTQEACVDGFEVTNRAQDRLHQREWEAVDFSNSFCASYQSLERISVATADQRNRITREAFSYEDLWGKVYQDLVRESKGDIQFLVDSLSTISREKQLTRSALAEMIVTFVQDIPYSYVLNIDCTDYETGDKPCIGNIALGLLSPYEFIHSLYGDCDTRAVLMYTLLEELGFDPMIVVSNQYAHAMLALNIPASGDHLTHRGNNYYFWETTAKGWPIGMLPPSTNNVNYWEIALVNEL